MATISVNKSITLHLFDMKNTDGTLNISKDTVVLMARSQAKEICNDLEGFRRLVSILPEWNGLGKGSPTNCSVYSRINTQK